MNHTRSLRLAVEVQAPAEVVWAAATDWSRQGEWILGTEVYVTSGDGASPGSRIAAFTGVGGIGFLDLMEITEWDPPRRCTVHHYGRLLRGGGEFMVEPRSPDRAAFIWAEHLQLPLGWLGLAGWQVVRPLSVVGLRRSLQRFAEFCRNYRQV